MNVITKYDFYKQFFKKNWTMSVKLMTRISKRGFSAVAGHISMSNARYVFIIGYRYAYCISRAYLSSMWQEFIERVH